jgi:hypothetical protein
MHQIITTYEGVWIKPSKFSTFAADGDKWSASHSNTVVQSEMHYSRPENKFIEYNFVIK